MRKSNDSMRSESLLKIIPSTNTHRMNESFLVCLFAQNMKFMNGKKFGVKNLIRFRFCRDDKTKLNKQSELAHQPLSGRSLKYDDTLFPLHLISLWK